MSICKKLQKKQKCLHKGPKMVDLDIFRVKLENNIVISEMIILKFVKLQSFSEKKEMFISAINHAFFRYF